ncbi:MAG: SMC family ATPase [Lachnospiraceae bacterium]|nr:SMC family ATPase [Lachnospiraceae bacterium]
MKPIKLVLCGWGPYREKQEIDFNRLSDRGLFLITGATGAGKTTLFDAITYALYGNLSGETREKNSVRSDFAGDDVKTYVELFMEHGGKKYHIYRNPEYLRPKKRKSGSADMTKEKENAVLTMPEGEKISGSSEVTGKIRELLRLDLKQFKQLSMIAQGEFTRLLTAPSAEKSRIFREIFDTDLYDKMAGELRLRSGSLYKQVMEYRHRMEEDVELFVPEEEKKEGWEELTKDRHYYYEEILGFLKQEVKEYEKEWRMLEKSGKEAEEEIERLTIAVTEGERIKNLSEKLAAEKERKQQLIKKQPEIKSREKMLEKAESAGQVKLFEEAWKNAVKQHQNRLSRLESAKEELAELNGQKEEESLFYQECENLASAYELADKAKELQKQLKDAAAELKKQRKELCRLQEQYLQAENEEEAAKADYENDDKRYRHGIAGILAGDLSEGLPCPVCGSRSHPRKAVPEKAMPTEKEVEEKKLLYEKKREERVKMHGKTAALKERTDVLMQNIEELEDTAARQKVLRDEETAFVKHYLENHGKTEFLEQKRAYEALLIMLCEKENALKNLQEEEAGLQKEKTKAREEYEEQRKGKGFSSQEEYKEAFRTEEEITKMRMAVSRFKEECSANEGLILHLEEELSGRKQVDIDELQQSLREKRDVKNKLYEKQSLKKSKWQEMIRLRESLEEKKEKVRNLEKQYSLVKDLDDAASGNNKLRLVFEQYVLASYFEEILRAANLRLSVMSGGRYELRRMKTVGDGRSKDNLEMEVLDYYTGKYRSVKTLSGGETFKVSLSLALGMSDVVQALSGGIRVDTLFIDEGFGSLDSESLEQACQTLNSLVEKDRLIGIISHVPELAEKIENQIRVNKTNAGSTIEVMIS